MQPSLHARTEKILVRHQPGWRATVTHDNNILSEYECDTERGMPISPHARRRNSARTAANSFAEAGKIVKFQVKFASAG